MSSDPSDETTLANDSFRLFVMDDTDDKALKHTLRSSFRTLRTRRRGLTGLVTSFNRQGMQQLWHSHDAMFFGDSKDSVGLQIADVCDFFLLRHLRGEPTDEVWKALQPYAICAAPEPEFSQCKEWLRVHDQP